LAKKARTPTPPRRVQAPKRRDVTAHRPGLDVRRQRTVLYGVAAAGVVALAVVVLVIVAFGGGGSSSNPGPAIRAAGGTLQTFPSQGRQHVPLTNKFKYNSFPPTSGPHYFQWVIWDQYDQPVRQIQEIHNLEHGGIVIQYGGKVSRSDIDKITAFYRSDPNAMLVAPLPALGNKIALTAWTHLATFTHFSEKGFKAFRDAYRYHGPEHFPPSALEPGE
jgi:hypothetical protein